MSLDTRTLVLTGGRIIATPLGVEGRFLGAFDLAVQDTAPGGVLTAVSTAIALDDPERMTRARELADTVLLDGRRLHTLSRLMLDAAAAVREGDGRTATALLTDALQLAQRTVDPAWAATFQALVCKLLGEDHPVGREAGLAARTWLR